MVAVSTEKGLAFCSFFFQYFFYYAAHSMETKCFFLYILVLLPKSRPFFFPSVIVRTLFCNNAREVARGESAPKQHDCF